LTNELLKLIGDSGTFCGEESMCMLVFELTNGAVNFCRVLFESGRNSFRETVRSFRINEHFVDVDGWHDGCLKPCVHEVHRSYARNKEHTHYMHNTHINTFVIHMRKRVYKRYTTDERTIEHACNTAMRFVRPMRWELGHADDYIESDCYGFSEIN